MVEVSDTDKRSSLLRHWIIFEGKRVLEWRPLDRIGFICILLSSLVFFLAKLQLTEEHFSEWQKS